jgi:glutamine synthetase
VPVEHLDMVLSDGAGFAGFALWGFGMGPEGPDYMAVGELDTLHAIPWMPGYARIVCNGTVKGKPYPFCSRVALKAQIARLAERGYTMYTGIEPEFMLLSRRADGSLGPADPSDDLDKPCYDYKGLSRTRAVLDEMVAALRAVGIDVYQVDHEDGNGQFEVNFTYADALKSADHFIFVKMAASEIAHRHGMIATFMPKPFSNRTGSGAHFHVSLGSAAQKNAFHDAADPKGLGLSALAYHFLGGVLHHARALSAVAAPTVNSYKRLVVGRSLSGATWAPAYIAYGDNNRTACVRIPHGRLEVRLPDAGCNPYLVSAALIAAGLDGIDRKLDPGKAHNVNLYELSAEQLAAEGIKLLPQALNEAIDALEADSVVRAGLGSALAAEFIRLKRMEWTEYARHVSDWESRRYLEFF